MKIDLASTFPTGNSADAGALGERFLLRAPITRLVIERLADRLRDTAMFAIAGEARDEVLTIAEELSDLARSERRAAEALDEAGPVQPWALRLALGFKSIKAARLLRHFVCAPGVHHRREVLLRAVETTPAALVAMVWDIRRVLGPLGLRGELRHIDRGYVLSQGGAEAICRHCAPDRIAILLKQHGVSLAVPALPPPALPIALFGGDTNLPSSGTDHGVLRLAATLRLFAAIREGGRRTADRSTKSRLLELVSGLSTMGLNLVTICSANPGVFLAHAALVARVGCADASLKILILKLRRHFMEAGFPDPIETKRGFGYRFAPAFLDRLAAMAAELHDGDG
ncbi:helix-turn-helix domain-containing protein [Novosphingobium sp. JCM 18896]|uniref:helix-turn-helix domain-containing protein n=1 Tax=Novosphingobium sp. JCM 18896 TaxID=2989731 RepID=UPI002222ECEB|nr:helix-turn-helix domain-containing protein [Novosphingobium sp. JCM 18896]MCW1430820.1 helix-turn-helix domain-containing protein [Novosphingobium sp. JCM 18896]